MYLSKYLSVQEKLQKELDEVIGVSRLPNLADRIQLPYTQSVIHEILRFSSLAPLSIFHNTTKDVQLAGFTIPKNTMFIPNLYAANFDKKIWKDPENFRPERFINEQGQFEKNDALMAFSYGKRACLGETLARDELFLFFASLFQRFYVICETEVDITPFPGTILTPNPHNFILKERF
jgi:cytochrome P450